MYLLYLLIQNNTGEHSKPNILHSAVSVMKSVGECGKHNGLCLKEIPEMILSLNACVSLNKSDVML